MELDRPFRGSEARARGLVRKRDLAGPHFVPLGPDVYVAAGVPLDQRTTARTAMVRHLDGAITGTAAALLYGVEEAVADVGRAGAATEVLVPTSGTRSRAGLDVREAALAIDEVVEQPDGAGHPPLRLTSPARTVLEVARRLPTVEAVVVGDALAGRTGFGARELVALADRHTGERGMARVRAVAALLEPWSDTPRRTRVRLGVLLARLPPPMVAWGDALDLAWPATRSGVLVDRGEDESLARAGHLIAGGWQIARFGAEPAHSVEHIVESIAVLLARVDRRLGRDLPDMRGRFPPRPRAPRVYGAAA
ncbi:hypothetical protein ACR9E3_27320 [Actinomycetospora sp. C-140]